MNFMHVDNNLRFEVEQLYCVLTQEIGSIFLQRDVSNFIGEDVSDIYYSHLTDDGILTESYHLISGKQLHVKISDCGIEDVHKYTFVVSDSGLTDKTFG